MPLFSENLKSPFRGLGFKNYKNMKKSNYFLAILAVLFSFSACNNIPEPPIPTPPEGLTVIFNETFGNPTQIGTSWPTIAQFSDLGGFVTTGIGAGAVRFAAEGGRVDVRGNFNSSFLGASGGGNVMFSAATGGTLFIHDIATCGARTLQLSFGSSQPAPAVSVAWRPSGDPDAWIEIPYEKVLTSWGLVSGLQIDLPEGTNTIHLRFRAVQTEMGARIDDVRLTTTDTSLGEPIIDPDTGGGGGDDTILFRETFGTSTQVGTSWPTIAEFTGFVTTGIGSAAVFYTTEGNRVDVRTTSASTFAGASGDANVMFNIGGASLFVNDIATCGATNFVLSFGTNSTSEVVSVAYRINGTANWVPIPFTKTSTNWELVDNLEITLPAGTNTIRLRFTVASQVAGSTNVRIDDIQLRTTDETGDPVIDPDGGGTSTLTVDPSSLNFTAAGGAEVITVNSNTTWGAGTSDPINFPISISGNTVTVTATANAGAQRSATIEIITTDETISRVVNVTQAGIGGGGEAIFLETFGTPVQVGTAWPSITDYTGWDNKSPIVFSGNTDVRSTSTLPAHVWFATANAATRFLTISGINTENVADMTLSFDLTHNAAAGISVNAAAVMTVSVKDLDTGTETMLTIPATDLPRNSFVTISGLTGIPATTDLEITFRTTAANTMGVRLTNVRIDGTR